MSTNNDATARLQDIQKRAKEVNNRRVALETEIAIMRSDYDAVVQELKEMGVDNLQDVPALLEQKKQELDSLLTSLEEDLTSAETILGTASE